MEKITKFLRLILIGLISSIMFSCINMSGNMNSESSGEPQRQGSHKGQFFNFLPARALSIEKIDKDFDYDHIAVSSGNNQTIILDKSEIQDLEDGVVYITPNRDETYHVSFFKNGKEIRQEVIR